MSLSLYQLQSNFSQALHYHSQGENCDITKSGFTANQRMQIYRNNFILSLSEVLALTYPTVLALVGEECFLGLARKHVLSSPLHQGDVSSYGAGFSDTISRVSQVVDSVPYLSDMARLEWALDLCGQKKSQSPAMPFLYNLEQASNLTPKQQALIHLYVEPSVCRTQSDWAVFSIYDAILSGNLDGVRVDTPEQGVVIYSKGKPQIHSLGQQEFQLLQQISSGYSLGELTDELVPHLETLLSLGLFLGFTRPTGEKMSKQIKQVIGYYDEVIERMQQLLIPLLLAFFRIWIAWVFFSAGLTKIASWDSTLYLFELEYQVPLIPWELAAYLATGTELIIPLFLIPGLFTRPLALLLFIFNIVAVISYPLLWEKGFYDHQLWAVMILTNIIWGAGSLSLDHWIRSKVIKISLKHCYLN